MLLKGKEVSPLTNWPLHTDSSSKALDMWNFKYSTPEYTCHFFQLSFSLQPKIWINVYFTTTKVTVVMKVKPMVMLMKEIMMAAIKLTALIMKVVEKKKEEAVLCIFLRCPTYCEDLTRSSAFAIVSKFFEGFVCWGALWVFFSPHSLQSLTPDRATSKLEELCFVGPWSLDSQHVVLWLWTSAPFNPFCRD